MDLLSSFPFGTADLCKPTKRLITFHVDVAGHPIHERDMSFRQGLLINQGRAWHQALSTSC